MYGCTGIGFIIPERKIEGQIIRYLLDEAGLRNKPRARLGDERQKAEKLRVRLGKLTSDGKDIQERRNELQQWAMAWEAARGQAREAESRLAKYQDDPQKAVVKLEAQFKNVSQEANRLRDEEIAQQGRLENLLAQGPYTLLCEAEEKLAQAQRDRRVLENRANAIRLLRETVDACRREAVAAVSQPVQVAATRTMQRICGRKLGRIGIGEGFIPDCVTPDQLQEAVSLEDLSGGEMEQLFVAVRLALAHVLAREERQLVVLDDVFTATDTGRLARILTVLEEASERLQVLVMTCHPERYRGMTNAVFFDLEDIIASASRNKT